MRLLRTRVASHKGVSYCTQFPLTQKEPSAIREHAIKCTVKVNDNDFVVLDSAPGETSLRILESLYIKRKSPSLNCDMSAVSLFIA